MQKKPSEPFVGIKHTNKYIHDEHAAGRFEKQRDANNVTAEGTHAREDSIEAMEVEAGRQNFSLNVPKLKMRDWRSV